MYFIDQRPTPKIIVNNSLSETVKEEVAPGVHIHRRQLLKLGLLGLGGAFFSHPFNTLLAKNNLTGSINFDTLIAELRPMAKSLVDASNGQADEEQYITHIINLLSRLTPMPEKPKPSGWGDKIDMRSIASYSPLEIMYITFEPGAKISLHDHYEYNGVLYGLKGELKSTNFDFYGKQDLKSDQDFIIQKNQEALIKAGDVSTLSRQRNNLHEVVAGKDGAEILDIFTFFKPDSTSRMIEYDKTTPFDQSKQLYKANWKSYSY